MDQRIVKTAGTAAVIVVASLGSAAPALAAKHHRHDARRHSVAQTSTSNGETPLTGQTLASASAAAIAANPGATVDSASTEADSSLSGAAYEVHITQADGTRALVIEDSSFNVLATQDETTSGPWSH